MINAHELLEVLKYYPKARAVYDEVIGEAWSFSKDISAALGERRVPGSELAGQVRELVEELDVKEKELQLLREASDEDSELSDKFIRDTKKALWINIEDALRRIKNNEKD